MCSGRQKTWAKICKKCGTMLTSSLMVRKEMKDVGLGSWPIFSRRDEMKLFDPILENHCTFVPCVQLTNLLRYDCSTRRGTSIRLVALVDRSYRAIGQQNSYANTHLLHRTQGTSSKNWNPFSRSWVHSPSSRCFGTIIKTNNLFAVIALQA